MIYSKSNPFENILPKLVVTDIDGVWTDGGMYYDNLGNEFKKFHTYDSAGILFLKQLNIPVAICTGETSNCVKRRSEKLMVDYLFQGVKNKLETITDLCQKLKINLNDVAYIGDDLNDINIMTNVGLSACPISAPPYIQEMVDVVIDKSGGSGAFRYFVEYIIGQDKVKEIIFST